MAEVTPELKRAKQDAEERLLALPGATGIDIGYKEVNGKPTDALAIRVLVAEKKPRSAVPENERIPEEIEGYPVDVIERRFELHQIGASVPVESMTTRVDSAAYDPLRGGVSVGPCRVVNGFLHAGTLGAIAIDNVSGRAVALSSFHVMCVDDGANVGDPMAQPSRVDGGRCPGSVIGGLRRHALTTSVDAAIADVGPSRRVTYEVVEVGTLTGTGTASLGEVVRKRGRTTRLTFGVVDSADLTVKVDYGHGIGIRTLTGQIGVRPDVSRSHAFMAKGDTGSVLLNEARQVVGLLVAGTDAGYGVANPIADVVEALNVRLDAGTGLHKVRMETKAGKEGKELFTEVEVHKELKDGKDLADFDERQKDFTDRVLGKSPVEEVSSDPRADQRPAKDFAKDFPIKEKEKEEVKDRKEETDLKQFEDRAKFKADKDVRIEKPNNKDFFKREKTEFEQPVPASLQGHFLPVHAFEQRLASIEAAVSQLRHFIDPSLRPDLRHGALTGEPDLPPGTVGGTQPADPSPPTGGQGNVEEQPGG
jgi:hypothetical protein